MCRGLFNFSNSEVAPLVEISENEYLLELFHGPTLAFKDVALQLVGKLFDHVLAQRNERVMIVGATVAIPVGQHLTEWLRVEMSTS